MEHTFTCTEAYIPLNKLLKLLDIGDSGWQVKTMISDWLVYVNGKQELRMRNKLVPGDIVRIESLGVTVKVVGA